MSPTKSTTDDQTAATRSYRLTRGTHTAWEGDKKTGQRVTYSANDPENNTIELTEEQARHPAFAGRIEALGQPGQYEMTVATAEATGEPKDTASTEVETGPPMGVGTRTTAPNANTPEAKALAEGKAQATTTASSTATGDSGGRLSGFSDLGWRDAVEQINGMSTADLKRARTMEEEREKPRTSVLEAIDAREKELKG